MERPICFIPQQLAVQMELGMGRFFIHLKITSWTSFDG